MPLKSTLALLFSLISALSIAQQHFDQAIQHLTDFKNYQSTDLSDVIVSDEYESSHNSMTHLYLKQRYQGIEILDAVTNFNIKEGEIIRAKGAFVSNIEEKVNTLSPKISASEALRIVIDAHDVQGVIPEIISISDASDQAVLFASGEIALEDIKTRLVYVQEKNVLKLCWEIGLYEKSGNHYWQTIIDTQTGVVLKEYDHVLHCDFSCAKKHTNRKHEKYKKPRVLLKQNAVAVPNSYNVYAYPVESPNHGGRCLLYTSPSPRD